ncbi:dephospho-CoA kinase [Tranquillimonas rosea]|uniref:Dephospho-CoA kinase n=1 Tax=Tranquillimonas rosea TaxID=641238 RepID=A0A1H9UEI6_9RHOB|nr:dephospho-CoA kinase [Tranquillimonas rosea]SES07980.1 dephospho-CoA kinase [Tranquillimonas rosea]
MTRPFVIGLTGSIGMGKSTTALLFADEGLPVWDADAAVHRLYGPGGDAVGPIGELRPEAVHEGGVDRTALSDWIAQDPSALRRIERIVHPLVAADRAAFIDGADADIVVLDIPLLFETGSDAEMDHVVVVSAPPEVQRRRVLERPGMTEARLDAILAKQLPDAQKRQRADDVVETRTLDAARSQVREILSKIRKRLSDA